MVVGDITEPSLFELNQHYKEAEVAEFLGIKVRTVRKMRQTGDGPKFIRMSSKCIRYRLKDLIEYQDANTDFKSRRL